MARTLSPREDVHLRTLSSSLGWLSGPEPPPFFVHGVQSHLPDYIPVLRGAIASHHVGPSTSPLPVLQTTHRAPWSPQSQSPHHPHLGSFF